MPRPSRSFSRPRQRSIGTFAVCCCVCSLLLIWFHRQQDWRRGCCSPCGSTQGQHWTHDMGLWRCVLDFRLVPDLFDLIDNKIGGAGAEALARALKENKTVTSVVLTRILWCLTIIINLFWICRQQNRCRRRQGPCRCPQDQDQSYSVKSHEYVLFY